MTSQLREALARVLSDQRRDPDQLVDDVYALARDPKWVETWLRHVMQLSVREGFLYDNDPDGVWAWAVWPNTIEFDPSVWTKTPCFVVRLRGESS